MTLLTRAEDVAAQIATRLATRTIALGAETDLGVSIYHGRRHVDDEMIPCSVIIEADDTPDDRTVLTSVSVGQRYVLFAYVPCDPLHPNVAAHKAIRDMKRAIFTTNGKPDRWWGQTIRGVKYLGRDIGPRADGAAFVLAAVEIEVSYVEDLTQP
jgi:hypothetical protein